MIKLISSAALGLSVIVALTTAPIHAAEAVGSFGIGTTATDAKQGGLEHVMKRVSGTDRREQLGYNVQPHDFSMTHRIPTQQAGSGRSIYKAGQFLFRR